ncbi:hypothetical protein L6164_037158 [Bauhinia variegata]|uniref:Uncharacterized protein n=1 Tax=Bauhinia variegata TaxID=167791 RepID=A0ACB9KJB3_BAUVA|nr:hypothetical protein L6164_037158 [Bauhinia variegata]
MALSSSLLSASIPMVAPVAKVAPFYKAAPGPGVSPASNVAPVARVSTVARLIQPKIKRAATPPSYSDLVLPLSRSDFPNDLFLGRCNLGIPEKIKDRSTGDIACDSYNLYMQDIDVMNEMGLDAYRFSISWSRIFPTGKLSDGVNPEGIKYYNDLIDALFKNGKTPFVTLLHVDRPQPLEDEYRGFLDTRMIDDFKDFVDVCFKNFGDRVKHWITFYEAYTYAYLGYALGMMAPARCSGWQGLNCVGGDSAKEPYIVGHNLLAHAAAVDLYNTQCRPTQNGIIGQSLSTTWYVPYSDREEDQDAASRVMDFYKGWFMEPLKTGDYPKSMRKLTASGIPDDDKKLHTKHFVLPICPNCIDQPDVAAKSQCLQGSLSITLTHFYPLAARVKDNAVIECNDAGVEFLEAQVNGYLSDFFEKPDLGSLLQFLPTETVGSLLLVQANFFKCGSLALAVSYSHKFGDAATASTFLKCWSACFQNLFLGQKLFTPPPAENRLLLNCIRRRYVFEESKIADLKAKVSSTTVPKPTRVESVAALVWKCASTATRINLGLTTRPSMMSQSVNIRKSVSPPLPENSVGNLVVPITVSPQEGEMDLQQLIIQIRKVLDVYSKDILPHLLGDENVFYKVFHDTNEYKKVASKDHMDFYIFISWCRMSFYDTDFGWGKPKWFSPCFTEVKNRLLLMDTSDGNGKEAFLTLSVEDMAVLENSEEFLEFASLNPRIK